MSKKYDLKIDEAIGALAQFTTAFCHLSTAWLAAMENNRTEPNQDDRDAAHAVLTTLAEGLAKEGPNASGYEMILGMLESAHKAPTRPMLRLIRDDN